MSSFPSLPLFTDAFIADTGHLSAQQTGAYMMLLMMAWRSPECRLPDDDDKLARWARVDRRTWLKIKPAVMEFWTLADGFWAQKRLSKERDVVSKRAEVARENGKQGGRPKSLENNDAGNPAGSARVAQQKAPNPIPNPIQDIAPVEPTESNPERPEDDIGVPAAPAPRKSSRTYFFESGVIRLTEPDFRKWEEAFEHISLRATLIGLTGYAQEQYEKTGNWFWPVQRACNKRNDEARLAVEKIKADAVAAANAPAPKKPAYLGP
jgi:uncharacterized protein YdaU (DUF1376 family)